MDKKLRYAYSCVGQGWWPILEKYIPGILAIDPDCEFEPKEKFGGLRLQAFCTIDRGVHDAVWQLEQEAEDVSKTVCEYCGQPGKPRTDRNWIKTLCNRCNSLDKNGMRAVFAEHRRLIDELEY